MLNYDVVVKLRDALSSIYWYKKDMINIINAFTDEHIGYERTQRYSKAELSKQTLDRLWGQERYNEIKSLIKQVLVVSDFSHFDDIENGEHYKNRALESIDNLKKAIKNNK